MGTFEPYIGKNIGRRPERVHFPTPTGVGGKNGYFLAPNGLKSGGYTLAKKGVFWDPTCKGIFGGPVPPPADVPLLPPPSTVHVAHGPIEFSHFPPFQPKLTSAALACI